MILKDKHIIFWLICFIIWCFALVMFHKFNNQPSQWISFILLTLMILILGFSISKISCYEKLSLPSSLNNLNPFQDLFAINHSGYITLSSDTEINSFQGIVKKYSHMIDPTDQNLENFINNVIDKKEGNYLLKGLKDHYYAIRCFYNHDANYVIVNDDITQFLSPYLHIEKNYHHLKKIINHIPFGIVYISESGHITGCNNTMCDFFKKNLSDVLGHPLKTFLKSVKDFGHIHDVLIGPQRGLLIYLKNYMCVFIPFQHDISFQDDAFHYSKIPSVIMNNNGKIIKHNITFLNLTQGQSYHNFYDYLDETSKNQYQKSLLKPSSPFELNMMSHHLNCYLTQLNDKKFLAQFIDMAPQKRLEQQFIQSQKMQAIGQLAGGVAHDFNNLLTGISGFCDLLLQRFMSNDPSYSDIIQIKQNSNRAANLVRQLLAFSRQQTLQFKIIDITETLSELTTLLQRLMGAGIDLNIQHGKNLWFIKVDVGQIEQVVVNLAVNARDAMNNNGKLIIKTQNMTIDHPKIVTQDTMPIGDYMCLEVSDTGHGIHPCDIERIFEPFFSTKPQGLGTGLGLSTVYGIIKQTGGYIHVKSQVGRGTTFNIYFPKENSTITKTTAPIDPISFDLSGQGRILLVEDEDTVRLFSSKALKDKGYDVFDFSSGEEALDWIQKGGIFDILMTDVVMPRMDGPTLNQKIKDIFPHVQTIFISGYTEDAFRNRVGTRQIHFLQKPFSLKDLAEKVKYVMKGM